LWAGQSAPGGPPGGQGAPVRFLPGQQQGSQAPGSPMGQRLPGGGTRRPSPQGPKRPSVQTAAKPKPKARSISTRR
jgi:hypothetical protein